MSPLYIGVEGIFLCVPPLMHLREEMSRTCVLTPYGKGCTRDIAYFLLTLGMKMALRAFWLPKVRG